MIPDTAADNDVYQWRTAERQRLIKLRLSTPAAERVALAHAIEGHLDEVVGSLVGKTVGVYWPFRGEPNLRRWMEGIWRRGGKSALPVVVRKAAPLIFRTWSPGEKLVPGVWSIPTPAIGDVVEPDIVVAPIVGFDPSCYRLGYGGGFYDRTLVAMSNRPRTIGVGYAQAAIATIYPMSHDVPMDCIVTEHGLVSPTSSPGR